MKPKPVAYGVSHRDKSAHIFQSEETAKVFGRPKALYTVKALRSVIDQVAQELDNLANNTYHLEHGGLKARTILCANLVRKLRKTLV